MILIQLFSGAISFKMIFRGSKSPHQLHKSESVSKNSSTKLCLVIDEEYNIDRRFLFRSSLSVFGSISSSMLLPTTARASQNPAVHVPPEASNINKKPFAPLETLLPAMRVKLTIEKAINLTSSLLPDSDNSHIDSEKTTDELSRILLTSQNYVRSLTLQGVPAKPADLYLESYKPMEGDLPFQRMLIQNGDVSTWKRLKQKEKQQEQKNEIRAALNAYTDNLSFSGDAYLLNVDKSTRSTMVREDRLPDIKQVITSDMGMRYLYRNQLLTAMEDVKAELEYQLGLKNVDGTDLLDLLFQARKAMDKWLSFIDEKDIQEALEVLNGKENSSS